MAGSTPLSRSAAGAIALLLAGVVLAADQISKALAIANLRPGEWVPVIGEFLVFRLVRNPGAAFSLGEGITWVFTLALLAVAVVIVVFVTTRVRSRVWAVVLGLLLGGVLGNLTDRMFRDPGFPVGHVVDFIHTGWMLPAIYNVADAFIVPMMIVIALLVMVGVNFSGERVRVGGRKAPARDEEPSAS